MKRSLLTLAFVVNTLLCLGQDIILNGSTVSLPNGHEKIEKDEAKKHAQQKFKGNKVANDIAADANDKTIYRVGDVLIMLNSQEKTIETNHFSKLKQSLDHMYRDDATYTSQIKRLNKNVILTVNNQSGGVGLYSVFACNANNTKTFTALIEYPAADKNKVDSIAEHIINHLRFKD